MSARILAILRKELLHIRRDPRSLVIVFLLPILMVLLYGHAVTFDIRDIKLGVIDEDKTPAARELVEGMVSSNYFRVSGTLERREEIGEAFLHRRMIAVLIIPRGFGAGLGSRSSTEVQVILDGSNANTATVALNYIRAYFTSRSLQANALLLQLPIDLQPRVWYNPDLKSVNFIVPGLVVVIMMLICALLTSVTVARERETGTMEQILVSPVRALEIIAGKTLPYILLAFVDGLLVIVFAWIWFSVPFRGAPLWLLFYALIFIYTCLSFGIFISARVPNQQLALMFAMVSTFLPSILLSGFVFPLASIPRVLQLLSAIVPAKYFLVIIRGIMLKGMDGAQLWQPALFLVLFGTLLILISVKRFKINLEG
ncbi:MAG TPA: ABC transporter permease [bacterium]|nr:ABC transporter permease [bacterium]HPR89733.1 ABC transporter permease [bacterium]